MKMEMKVYKKKIMLEVEISTIIGKPMLESRAAEITSALQGIIPLVENTEAIMTKAKFQVSQTKEEVRSDTSPMY